jgi:hypothetical protein
MQIRARLGLTALFILLCGLQGAAVPQEPAGFVAAYRWVLDDPRFGGLSSIEISADGSRLTALSDRSTWITAKIERDAAGTITAIAVEGIGALQDASGRALRHTQADSEGLAIAADGTVYVSFEIRTRVMRFDALDQPGAVLPLDRSFAHFPANGALEALAVDGAGRLFTLPEDGLGDGGGFPVVRLEGSAWTHVFALPRAGNFLPVGADFGPDGRLYVLERQFLGLAGFASRVRAFAIPAAGETPRIETVLETPPGLHDNLEGLAVWRDADGALRLTMISDDNFSFYLRSEIVEYRLPG